MKNKKYNFIRTSDSDTAELLRKEGFTEITEPSSSAYCFINNGKKLTFDAEQNGIVYTNLLCL